MEQYQNDDPFNERRGSTIERDDGEWCYEKKNKKWQQVLLPRTGALDPADYPEKQRRRDNTLQMLRDTATEWKLDDPGVAHNEGFLRDHPRYHDLFIKWAMRYLRQQGLDKSKYSGRVDESEGHLLDPNGRWSGKWLVNEVANGRDWIDEYIALELRISEGFIDITHDENRRGALGVRPDHSGWWTLDEI